MSDVDELFRRNDDPANDHRGPRRKRSWIPALAMLAVIVLVGYLLVSWGIGVYQDRFGPPPDFEGAGAGAVLVQVRDGQGAADIGRTLKAKGVVKSVDAFTEAAAKDDRSRGIQVGFYELKKQLPARSALGVLVNPKNLVQSVVTVPEGARVRNVVATILKRTDLKEAAVTAALKKPASIGLPARAHGNPEGYLYPATYSVPPDMTAAQLISQMVAKTVSVEKELDLDGRARSVGLTPEQVLTVASLLEYEANRDEDYPKVARVIYNRLALPMRLQFDSTVSYVSGREGDVWTTAKERSSDSAYNTYNHDGLPPGPIGSPGEATIEAALNPAEGNWLYFVPDFATGKTLFTADYQQHLKNAAKAKKYCQTHDEC